MTNGAFTFVHPLSLSFALSYNSSVFLLATFALAVPVLVPVRRLILVCPDAPPPLRLYLACLHFPLLSAALSHSGLMRRCACVCVVVVAGPARTPRPS